MAEADTSEIFRNVTNHYHPIVDGSRPLDTTLKLSYLPQLAEGKSLQVLTIGGSTWHSALLEKTATGYELMSEMLKGQYHEQFDSGQEFVGFIARQIDSTADALALNLAFEVDPLPSQYGLDAIFNDADTKEHKLSDITGRSMRELLEQACQKLAKALPPQFAVANDASCLLLTAHTPQPFASNQAVVATVVGTGANTGVWRQGELLNLEMGMFSGLAQSAAGVAIDATSLNPGQSILEKEVAGAYLYRHFNHATKRSLESTAELAVVATENGDDANLARKLFSDAGSLWGSAVAGVVTLLPESEVEVICEGALVLKQPEFRKAFMKAVKHYNPDKNLSFTDTAQSYLWGAAKLFR